jgi:hypothetical protein
MRTKSTTPRTDSPQFDSLAERLKAWRATRTHGQRIPEDLWKAAADLARVHGLNPTAAALKLNYYGLDRRLSGGRGLRKRPLIPTPFVELSSSTLAPHFGERGTLELVQASGARLTLRLPNASPKDLLPLVQMFLRHRS